MKERKVEKERENIGAGERRVSKYLLLVCL